MIGLAQELDAAEAFVDALTRRDFAALQGCLTSAVRFRALIPPGQREAEGDEQTAAMFRRWFGDAESVVLLDRQIGRVGDRVSIGYRMRVEEDGEHVVEQHAFADVEEGRIVALDLVCSGFRPVEASG